MHDDPPHDTLPLMSQYARAVKARRYEEALSLLMEAGLPRANAYGFLVDDVANRTPGATTTTPTPTVAVIDEAAERRRVELERLEAEAGVVHLRRARR